jgi:hypothetical protein
MNGQIVEIDRMRNANREALTALRKRARTTKTSVPSPFEIIMKEMEGTSGKQLVKEICPTCGNHDPKEHTWLTFPGSDIFSRVPFHVGHTVLDKGTFLIHDTSEFTTEMGSIYSWGNAATIHFYIYDYHGLSFVRMCCFIC